MIKTRHVAVVWGLPRPCPTPVMLHVCYANLFPCRKVRSGEETGSMKRDREMVAGRQEELGNKRRCGSN